MKLLVEEAATLMEYLPPVGWADAATKHDLAALGAELLGAMHGESGAVQREFGVVRGEIGALRGDMGELRGEMRSEMAALRTEVHDQLREQTTRLVTWMIPTWLSAVGIAVAVTQLG